MNFLPPGSGGNEMLVLSWVRVRLAHTHPGETTRAPTARLSSPHRVHASPSLLFAGRGSTSPFSLVAVIWKLGTVFPRML